MTRRESIEGNDATGEADTHGSIIVAKRFLDLGKGNESIIFKVLDEAKCFNVFLESRRYLALIAPVIFAHQLRFHF